jgi:hypothetical protein
MKNLNVWNIFVTKQYLPQSFLKLHIYFKTNVVSGIFGWIFFMVYDIDIHELNLRPFKNLKFLDEVSFLKCVFFFIFEQWMHNNIYILKKKTTTISKMRRFYRWALHYSFNFLLFGNVSWIINMRPYGYWKTISYILYVH